MIQVPYWALELFSHGRGGVTGRNCRQRGGGLSISLPWPSGAFVIYLCIYIIFTPPDPQRALRIALFLRADGAGREGSP